MKFVPRWIGGVSINRARITSRLGTSMGDTNSSAPIKRLSWSNPGAAPPLEIPIRRLRKLFARSPSRAPSASSGPINHRPCRIPTRLPTINPTRNPRIVFPSPRIRRPSPSFLSMSIGGPPPATTGAAFAKYAGRMNQMASAMRWSRSVKFSLHF